MLSGDSANIDVRKYEKEQSLLIIDSLKGYFGLQGGLMPFLIQTADFAKKSEKRILTWDRFSTMIRRTISYNTRWHLPSKYGYMNLKGFCAYHLRDFDNRLSEKERRVLIKHHGKTLILLSSSSSSS